MHTLKFKADSDTSQATFEIMFESIFIYGSIRERKGRAVLVQENELILKLMMIGRICEPLTYVIRDEPSYELNKDGDNQELQLTTKEVEFFIQYISETPWSTGNPSRKALAVISILENLIGRTNGYSGISPN